MLLRHRYLATRAELIAGPVSARGDLHLDRRGLTGLRVAGRTDRSHDVAGKPAMPRLFRREVPRPRSRMTTRVSTSSTAWASGILTGAVSAARHPRRLSRRPGRALPGGSSSSGTGTGYFPSKQARHSRFSGNVVAAVSPASDT